MSNNLIEVRNLVKHFEVSKSVFSRNKKIVKAVDGISFDIKAGETLGLVGQSGCGKTTTARSLCLLDPKTSGSVNFYNPDTQNMESIDNIDEDGMRIFRRNMQMIFQDPYESLNPRWTIKDIIKEPLDIHNIGSFDEREEAVMEILRTVGLTPPENYLNRYPHEISGGQRQRVSIARTLVMKPKFVICDEPTSMLDVSIRISIMDLMLNLAKELDVSYLYITHDLAVARYMCNRIAVMFNGKIVEIAETEELLQNPIHPYTKRLISSIPIPDPKYARERYEINFDELDKIVKDNPNEQMVDVGNNHFVATHETKEYLIES
jgi:peptide/nickel transport system ATP-binding protein|tara:strand:- start:498 stop:1457 length:960 start_codon:yes stop_codon:yes gene_type:complete